MQTATLQNLIEDELGQVSQTIAECLRRPEHPSVLKINNFVLSGQSKKIRPTLVLLVFRSLCGPEEQGEKLLEAIRGAVSMEMMHGASLIHDDIIDHADTRHSKPSIFAKWGPETAVALGNYIYSEAFHLISLSESPEAVRTLTLATREMCEGEFVQLCERSNNHLSEELYLEIIRLKTASLFAASCRMGAIAAKADTETIEHAYDFGMALGLAYQIMDDYMDILSPSSALGKNPGQDIAEGDLTLPLIYYLAEQGYSQESQDLLKASADPAVFEELKGKLKASAASSQTEQKILSYVTEAKQQLAALPESEYRQALSDLVDFVQNRIQPS